MERDRRETNIREREIKESKPRRQVLGKRMQNERQEERA
jgi:hypothetical protein